MIGLKTAGSTASGFLGMKMVLASIRWFGSFSHLTVNLRTLTKTLIGTARSYLGVRPSRPRAIDKSSVAAFISPGVIGSQKTLSIDFRRASGIPFSPLEVAECL